MFPAESFHVVDEATSPDQVIAQHTSRQFSIWNSGWPGLERGTSETPVRSEHNQPGLPSQAQSSPGHPIAILSVAYQP